MKNSESKYWIIDNATLKKLQVLKSFVDFVTGLEETRPELKPLAENIKFCIKNLNKPETFKYWSVYIWLIDYDIATRSSDFYIYNRNWWIHFEGNMLSIESKTVFKNCDPFDDEFHFNTFINFNEPTKEEHILGETDFSDFVNDAQKFRDYITEHLNSVEAEIEFENFH